VAATSKLVPGSKVLVAATQHKEAMADSMEVATQHKEAMARKAATGPGLPPVAKGQQGMPGRATRFGLSTHPRLEGCRQQQAQLEDL